MSEESNIFSKGCNVIFKSRFWGASKKLQPEHLGDLPEKIIHATRDLLTDRTALDAVNWVRADAKRFIKGNSVYSPITNVDFIPKGRIRLVDDGLKYRKEKATRNVEVLIDQLSELESRYASEYPDLYSAGDYPTPAQLRSNFTFYWVFRAFVMPDKELQLLDPDMYEAEVKKMRTEVKEVSDGLVSIVAEQFYSRIDKLKEQCLFGNVSQQTVKSVHDVLEKFDNLWDGFVSHDTLRKSIQDIKDYMDGTNTGMLKADDDFRKIVGNKMSEICSTIKNSEDPRLTRKLNL